MIHQMIYMSLGGAKAVNMAAFGAPPKMISPWNIIKGNLETTEDHLIWVVTTEQLAQFCSDIKRHGLDKFLVIDHSKEGQGTTNRNYPDRQFRLKVFIMKGVGNV